MAVTVVRYTTRPERADENQALVEKVFGELAERRPDGLRYATFRLEDGVTFVHVASVDTEDGSNPLAATAAFGAFQQRDRRSVRGRAARHGRTGRRVLRLRVRFGSARRRRMAEATTATGPPTDPGRCRPRAAGRPTRPTGTRRSTRRPSWCRSARPSSATTCGASTTSRAMLVEQGDWVPLGNADEQKPAAEGTVEAWARSERQPGRRLVRPQEGPARPVRELRPAGAGAARLGRGRAQPPQQPHARDLTRTDDRRWPPPRPQATPSRRWATRTGGRSSSCSSARGTVGAARSRTSCRSAGPRCPATSGCSRTPGLVIEEPVGTRRIYRLQHEGVEAVEAYLRQVWGEAATRFRLTAENTAPRPPDRPRKGAP